MDPIAMVSMGSSALGGITKAAGSIFEGQSKASMYNYQAGVANVNKQIALQNAVYSREVGETKAEQSGMKSRAQAGQIKAVQASRGLRLDSGSAVAVQDSQAQIARHEQAVIRSNAARAAYGHEVEALNFGAKAAMASSAAKQSKIGGFINAFSSILGGATSVSSKWMQFGSTFGTGEGEEEYNEAYS